ncbi:MAG TPA: hypothetical protein VFE32_09155 [Puia sp.]|jgi:hypothetical protein|nr:hypothetical protein [Puia sp.]
MRKIAIVLSVVLVLVSAGRTLAQTSVELIPQVGYSFPARNDFYNTYGRIEGGLNLGGAINFNINRNVGIEVLYNHVSSSSGLYYYGYDGGNQITAGHLSQDFIMAGPVFSGNIPNSTVRPFLGLLLGADIMTPSPGYQSNSYFAAGFQVGTNIYISPRVGIQLKAQFLSPVGAAGGAFYYNNYYGGGIDPNQSTYQFTLGGGLIIGLGRVLPQPHPRPVYRRPRPRYYRYY